MNFQDGGTGDRHRIEQLGLALDRASSILSTLTACYDSSKHKFVVSEDYVVHAVASIENFIEDAKAAHQHFVTPSNIAAPHAQPAPTTVFADAFLLNNTPNAQPQLDGFAEEPIASPAQFEETNAASYDELLRKLTAAEVFAAESQNNHQSHANTALLPLLKSLRNDLQKIRAA